MSPQVRKKIARFYDAVAHNVRQPSKGPSAPGLAVAAKKQVWGSEFYQVAFGLWKDSESFGVPRITFSTRIPWALQGSPFPKNAVGFGQMVASIREHQHQGVTAQCGDWLLFRSEGFQSFFLHANRVTDTQITHVKIARNLDTEEFMAGRMPLEPATANDQLAVASGTAVDLPAVLLENFKRGRDVRCSLHLTTQGAGYCIQQSIALSGGMAVTTELSVGIDEVALMGMARQGVEGLRLPTRELLDGDCLNNALWLGELILAMVFPEIHRTDVKARLAECASEMSQPEKPIAVLSDGSLGDVEQSYPDRIFSIYIGTSPTYENGQCVKPSCRYGTSDVRGLDYTLRFRFGRVPDERLSPLAAGLHAYFTR